MDAPTDLIGDVILKTSLVLAVLYGALWAVRRFSRGLGVARRGPAITVLQSAHLGPGRTLHLVGVGDKTLLIGATSQQVALLADLGLFEAEPVMEEELVNSSFESYFRRATELASSVSSRLKGKAVGSGSQDGQEGGAAG